MAFYSRGENVYLNGQNKIPASRLTGVVETHEGYLVELSRDFKGHYRATAHNGDGRFLSTPHYSGSGSRNSALMEIRKRINAVVKAQ